MEWEHVPIVLPSHIIHPTQPYLPVGQGCKFFESQVSCASLFVCHKSIKQFLRLLSIAANCQQSGRNMITKSCHEWHQSPVVWSAPTIMQSWVRITTFFAFSVYIVYLNDSILLIELKKNENNLKRGRCLFIFFGNTIDLRASPKRDTFRAFNGHVYIATSVTRFGDFLDFGQLFKAFCSN